MKLQEVIGGMILLILIYLLVNNARGSSQVIEALASGTGATVKALQGR